MKLKKCYLLVLVLVTGCYSMGPCGYGSGVGRGYGSMPRLRLPVERTVVIESVPELGTVNVFEGVMGQGYYK